MNLWLFSVIPSLLPFFIITEILKEINGISIISKLPAKVLCPLLHITENSSYAVLTGLLCGYPMGAKVTADLYESGQISRKEADYLLTFVNNPSPVFIITYIFTKSLSSQTYLSLCLVLLYASVCLTALIYSISFRRKNKPEFIPNSVISHSGFSTSGVLDNCIYKSFHVMLKIGGYLILFSILAAILKQLLHTNPFIHACIIGILETTTGIFSLSPLAIGEYQKAGVMCLMASFGGLSTLMQTKSMISGSGLSLFPYLKGKLTSTFLLFILFMLFAG